MFSCYFTTLILMEFYSDALDLQGNPIFKCKCLQKVVNSTHFLAHYLCWHVVMVNTSRRGEFVPLASNYELINIDALLTKLVQSKWLDIGQVLFFCVFMDRNEVEVHKNAKKRTRPISSHLDRTSLVNKGFIIWPKDYTKEFRFCGNKAGNPERAR